MAWNPQLNTPGTNWQGNQPLATLRQLNSSIGYTSTVSNVLSTTINFNVSTLAKQISSIVAGGTTSLWANYPAISNVNIAGCNITNAGTVTATQFNGSLTGNVTGNVSGNTSGTHTGNVVGNISNTNLTVNAQYSITETADVGSAVSNYASYGTVNISGKGGLGGIVNITADVATPNNPAVTVSQLTMEAKGNYGLITPGTPVGYIPRGGLVSITARQGLTPTPPAEVTSALFANGEIDLTAYSYGIVPGLIKMSAGANFMYAGAFSPITGIFGNNYIAATVANTMTAGLPPGGIPTLVGTNYFYAVLGVGGAGTQIVGNRFQGGVGIDFLQPYPNGDLIIQSNANGTDTVVISGVKSLAMSNGGNITGVGNISLTTINSAAYPPVGNQTFSNVSTNSISSGTALISTIFTNNISSGTISVSTIFTNNISSGTISVSTIFTNNISSGTISVSTIFTNNISSGTASVSSIFTNYISSANTSVSSINANSLSTATASVSSLTTNALSTATAIISSINGYSVYDLLNKTPSNLSTNSLSTSFLQVSTIQAGTMYISSLFASTVTVCNLIDNFYSTTTGTFDVINVSSLYGGTLAGDFIDVSGARISFKNCNSDASDPAGVQIYTSNDNYYVTATIPTAISLSSYTSMTSWTNQTSNFITNPSYFPSLPGGSVNITLNGGNYFIGTVATETNGRNFYTNNSGFYQLVTIKAGQLYVNLPNGSYSFWTSNSAGFVVFFEDVVGNRQGEPAYVEANEYATINYFNIGSPNFSYTITNNIPAIAYTSTNTTSITNLVMDNFDTILTTSNTYGASGITYGFAGNLALNYSTIAFGPSTVRGATYPYTFSGTVQAPQVSSMNVNLSSINGYAFSDIVNPGYTYSTFSNVYLTPANGFGLNMSTGSIGTSFDTISSVSANILKATMSFTTTDQAFIPFTPPQMNIGPSNINIWASTIVKVTQPQVGTVSNSISLDILGGRTGQVDVCNTSGCNAFIKGGILGFLPNNSWRRFTYNGSFWTQNFSPTPQNATYDTTLNIYQKYDGAYINTGDYLYLSTGGVQVDGDFYADNVYPKSLQVTGTTTLNDVFVNTLDATTITAANIYAPITSATINVSNINYSTISGRPGEGQTGISQLLNYGSIGTRLNYTDTNTNHFNAFPWVSSLNTTTVAQGQISYPTYPGDKFTLVPSHTGSNTYYLNNNGTVSSPSNTPCNTWTSSIMNCYFQTYPNPSDTIMNPGRRGEVILVGCNSAPSAYFFQFNGTSAIQAFMTLGSIHKWTCTDGTNWTCNTSASLYPTTTYTDTMSLVQKPGGVLSLNAQYIAFSDLTVVTYNQRKEANLEFIQGAYGKAQINDIPVEYNGKRFKVNDYVCTVAFTQYGARQPSLATNEVAANCQDDGSGFWKMQIRLTTPTISFEWSKGVYWQYQVTLTPRPLATGTHTQASFDEPEDWHAVEFPEMIISSIFTSTITMRVSENMSFNAGVSTPTFLGNGNIAINANSNIDLMANYDINVDAAHDINATATHAITLASPNINMNGATGIGGTLYLNRHNIEDVQDLYLKRNLIFQSTSTYIADLGHIYGNTASPGGGLAIDYMYGLFFNSAGNDANIYASGGYFNLRNMARGIEVAGYNPAGTGDSAFYVANNELYLATGTGHDVITNSGRNIAMNAALPGGTIGLYTSTINTTSLLDTNITANRNMTLRADHAGNSITSIASTITLQAANNINLNAADLIYTGASKLWGSNVGNSLGLYRPLRFYYEPPTAAGQSAEINIEAHPADAGVHFSLRYGVDLAGGYGYLLCEWPGYIVVPMKIYGQDIALEGGETVHINTANGIYNNTSGSFNVSSITTNIEASQNITLTVNSSDTGGVIITDTSTGGTGRLTVDSSNNLYWNGVQLN